ncbi:MAG TPA: NAD(+) synthase [Prosthecobacter sp.]|nr:NAD(+) synthase [Prosthecobacter sp.]HRK17052.1 NAD(+) synthase [Prosthecobacter sp.]
MSDPTQNLPEHEKHGFVRAAVVSPELRVGDAEFNAGVIRAEMKRLSGEGCRVAVFPELCLTGYSCADLFYLPTLQKQALAALRQLAEESSYSGMLTVLGLPLAVDGRLYNMAAVAGAGRVLGFVPKTFLPNSGEFYERRWFSPAHTLGVAEVEGVPAGADLLFEARDLPGLVLGVEICEDLWSVIPPSSHAALAGATVLANPSASNELLGKAPYRRNLVLQQSARCLAAYLYASAGAGESSTDTVYSGHGIIAENGALLAESERFSFETRAVLADVDLQRLEHERQRSAAFRDEAAGRCFRRVVCTLDGRRAASSRLLRPLSAQPFVPPPGSDRDAACREIFAIQSTGLARRLRQTKSAAAVIGLSGGLDSTLALLVLLDALPRAGMSRECALAVTMPGPGTTERTRGNAEKLAGALGVPLRVIPIHAAVERHFKDIGHPPDRHDITFENAQARERTQVLMDVANQTGGLVVGTGDLSEAALGWCTFNGDHMSMYHVNAGVPKTLVRYLIEWCAAGQYAAEAGEILRDIIATPISPELLPAAADGGIGQRTEDVVGPYELHDFFLYHFARHGCGREKLRYLAGIAFAGSHTPEVIEKWLGVFLRRFVQNQFKRSSMPDGPKVGTVALSPRADWRMPSDYGGSL